MKKLKVVNTGASAAQQPAHQSTPATPAGEVRTRGSQYWRSLEDKLASHDEKADAWKEFADEADSLEIPADGVSRRKFFGLVGSGAALAGMSATGCKPVENILPYSKRPEDLIPGKPMYYASAFQVGAAVEGILVESHDGRPIKIEGNPKHPGSQGGTNVFAQASILDLYDPDRSRIPMLSEDLTKLEHERVEQARLKGAPKADQELGWWRIARKGLGDMLETSAEAQGEGLALVLPLVLSPTDRGSLSAFRRRFPKARLFHSDLLANDNSVAAAKLLGGEPARFRYSLAGVKVVVSADADFLNGESDATRLAREWAQERRLHKPVSGLGNEMSRLYVFEPHLSGTGLMADHRRRVKGSQVGDVLIALAKELMGGTSPKLTAPTGADIDGLPAVNLPPETAKMVKVLADDLLAARPVQVKALWAGSKPGPDSHRKKPLQHSAIVVGDRQPAWVHALGLMINTALGNTGASLRWRMDARAPKTEGLVELSKAAGTTVKTVIAIGTNPVYDAPADLEMGAALAKTELWHIGLYRDETGQAAAWHLPLSHYLEAWSDLEAGDGTVSVCQPLIEPLHNTYSTTELLHFIGTGSMLRGDEIVQAHWKGQLGAKFSERQWRRWLHDGITGPARAGRGPSVAWGKVGQSVATGRKPVDGFEVNLHVDPRIGDGRFANNGWLQELPHPLTKVAWDNVACISPATAAKAGLANGDLVNITVGSASLQMPAFIAPGQADETVSVTLGGGRKVVRWDDDVAVVSEGAGFNGGVLLTSTLGWMAAGNMTAAGGDYPLANTQDYGRMKPPVLKGIEYPERPIVIEATVDEFAKEPLFIEKANLIPKEKLQHLWEPPKLTGKQQWGMSVDLNTCTGCGSCVIACQAENNIPVVGKQRVIEGRELHWMRLDRYYRGDEDDPTAVVQPMFCQHCEAAPCETVCPVAATTHSPEGLNDMAYNRCIGTRYCSNNCPYKVRRFNFFNHNLDLRPGGYIAFPDSAEGRKETKGEDAWISQMQKNPDVTIRFRGVMEKCTYCVQRINGAKIEAHVAGQDTVADGGIVVACQQVCNTGALLFGDIRDSGSAVAKAKSSPRDYTVLRDLNNHPRTTYLARIRNPNPALV